MRSIGRSAFVAAAMLLFLPRIVLAGMPVVTLTDIVRMRVQAISFFLLCFMLSAWVVQRIWNSARADFPRLPWLSYRRSIGLVTLWGLLFLLVLTMISGARELMTPGAWKKEGYTFKLVDEKPAEPQVHPDAERRGAIDRLRAALWTYARSHEGNFPPKGAREVPEDAWQVPEPARMKYFYVEGLVADRGESPLAYEPRIFDDDQLVLMTNGQIRKLTEERLKEALGKGGH
jgi:hypothetical protein